jgi:hypothetical protein
MSLDFTFCGLLHWLASGAYILENTPPPGGGGNICRCHLGEKYEKVKRKRGKSKRKRKKVGRKRKKGERK